VRRELSSAVGWLQRCKAVSNVLKASTFVDPDGTDRNEDRPQFDKFIWERREKKRQIRIVLKRTFSATIQAVFTEGLSPTLGWQRPRRVAAATITSTPKRNSELADLRGRTLGASTRRSG
jgi:hypothetical protein